MRHGFYSRRVCLSDGTVVEIMVVRYLCRAKGRRAVAAVTFSLLPLEVVPYHGLALSFMLEILIFWKVLGHTIFGTLDFVADKARHVELLLSPRSIARMATLFNEAFERLIIDRRYSSWLLGLGGLPLGASQVAFLKAVSARPSVEGTAGIVTLEAEYYFGNGGAPRNARFLFGTPSQFRFG